MIKTDDNGWQVRTRKSAEPSMAVRVTERLMDQTKTGIEVDTLTFLHL